MRQYVFPVVFIKNEDNSFLAHSPDLNISIDGDTIEEAFLFIQDFISIYCSYAVKDGEEESLIPTKFEKIAEQNQSKIVMLVDAFVK